MRNCCRGKDFLEGLKKMFKMLKERRGFDRYSGGLVTDNINTQLITSLKKVILRFEYNVQNEDTGCFVIAWRYCVEANISLQLIDCCRKTYKKVA
jgi:hypothetical protein